MGTYVLAYTGGSMPETDADRAAVMSAWEGWFAGLGESVADGGNPFGASAGIAPDGSVSQPARSGLTGYSIIKADSLDAATVHAKGCPVLGGGGSIEVYETFDVM